MKKIKFFHLIIAVLFLFFLLCVSACNNESNMGEPLSTEPSATEAQHTHSWIEATCTTPKTCSTCSAIEGDALGHIWKDAICAAPKTCSTCSATEGEALTHTFQDATCTKPKTCSVCGKAEGTAIGHNWVEATCTTPKTCQNCQTTEGKTIAHELSRRNNCIVCGKGCSVKLNMSNADKNLATNVQSAFFFVSTRANGYDLSFSCSKTHELDGLFKAPAILDITILNIKGETVYSKTKKIETKDYQTIDGGPWASINISVNELSNISVPLEKVYVDIYNPGYFYFDGELSTNMPATIIMPELPKKVYGNNSSIEITNISFSISSSTLYYSELYFDGEKTWDLKGDNYSREGYISYKLYDSENYLIDSGTCYTNALAVGDKFRNEDAYIDGELLMGYIYRLEILDTK